MPNFDFLCPACKREKEVFLWVSESDHSQFCVCGEQMNKTFKEVQIIGVEFKGGIAFNPKTGEDVPYRGGHFDLAAGRYFHDKNERKQWMKEKGLKEVGNDWDKPLALHQVKEETIIAREQRKALDSPPPAA